MAKRGKVLVTAWVDRDLRIRANIAAQLTRTSITQTVIKALEELVARGKEV